MKKYLSFFRIRFINGMQYRAAAYAGVCTQFAWGFMSLLMYKAFYKADASAFPMTFPELSSYIWLQQAFLALFALWIMDNDIFELIKSGDIAYELSRPMDIYTMWVTKNIANRTSKAVLRCMPIILVAAFLPAPLSLEPPKSVAHFLLFLFSGLLALLVVATFCVLIYVITFFTVSPMGVRMLAISIVEFASGQLVPLPFMPTALRHVLEILPFASLQVPMRVYSGNISGSAAFQSILLQLFWITALIIAGKLLMKKALRKIVVQGG